MTAAEQLRERGYCVVRGVLDANALRLARHVADRQCAGREWQTEKVQDTLTVHPGIPGYRPFIIHPKVTALFPGLGFSSPRWFGGALIPKPPGEPRRPWHQDWWGWDHPEALWEDSPQVGLMFYLSDTTKGTGCLVVAPGSHRFENPIHKRYILEARDEQAEEEAVEVSAGDMVVLDARTLHATTAHGGSHVRYCVTVWWMPHYDRLSEDVRCYAANSTREWGPTLDEYCPVFTGRPQECNRNYYPIWVPEHQNGRVQ